MSLLPWLVVYVLCQYVYFHYMYEHDANESSANDSIFIVLMIVFVPGLLVEIIISSFADNDGEN